MSKRLFDLAVSVLLLTLLAPAFLILVLLVFLRLGSPVFFAQERPGLHGTPFRICKLRTMTADRDAAGKLLSDGERLEFLGRFLRATSLDELP